MVNKHGAAGQRCSEGHSKSTYGTGCFLLLHTGTQRVASTSGLLSTIAYRLGNDQPVQFALEGSIAIAGMAVAWLRDQLGLIASAAESESVAAAVDDTGARSNPAGAVARGIPGTASLQISSLQRCFSRTAALCVNRLRRSRAAGGKGTAGRCAGGVYFVPAFSGLLAPHWRDDARGTLLGISQYTNRHHIVRAVLEGIAFQVRDVLAAAASDAGLPVDELRVDGGACSNGLLMQLQVRFTPRRGPS